MVEIQGCKLRSCVIHRTRSLGVNIVNNKQPFVITPYQVVVSFCGLHAPAQALLSTLPSFFFARSFSRWVQNFAAIHPAVKEGGSSPTLWLWSACGKDARVSEGMVSTARSSFMDEEADPGPESRYSGSFSCGTSEGSRIWCNRTDTMGIIMAAMAL